LVVKAMVSVLERSSSRKSSRTNSLGDLELQAVKGEDTNGVGKLMELHRKINQRAWRKNGRRKDIGRLRKEKFSGYSRALRKPVQKSGLIRQRRMAWKTLLPSEKPGSARFKLWQISPGLLTKCTDPRKKSERTKRRDRRVGDHGAHEMKAGPTKTWEVNGQSTLGSLVLSAATKVDEKSEHVVLSRAQARRSPTLTQLGVVVLQEEGTADPPIKSFLKGGRGPGPKTGGPQIRN